MKQRQIDSKAVPQYYGVDKAITRLLKVQPKLVYKYVDGKMTDEVIAQRISVIFEDVATDVVKLPLEAKINDLKAYQRIEFDNLEGSEINGTVYWRANDVHAVKESNHDQ